MDFKVYIASTFMTLVDNGWNPQGSPSEKNEIYR